MTQNAGQQAVAGNVRHQQHFARAGDGLAIGVPEANQTEGAQADQFPAEIEDEEVGAVDQADEAADEDQHGAIEARCRLVVGHVADGVEQHQSADARAHESEQHAQRIHMQHQGQRRIPLKEIQVDGLPAAQIAQSANDGQDCRYTTEEGENTLRPGRAEPLDGDLQQRAKDE